MVSAQRHHRRASCILAKLSWTIIIAGLASVYRSVAALQHDRPGSRVDLQRLPSGGGSGGSEGSQAHHRRRKHRPRPHTDRGCATGDAVTAVEAGKSGDAVTTRCPDAVEIRGADLGGRSATQLDGVYVRKWDVNSAPHFKKRGNKVSLYRRWHLFAKSQDDDEPPWRASIDARRTLPEAIQSGTRASLATSHQATKL